MGKDKLKVAILACPGLMSVFGGRVAKVQLLIIVCRESNIEDKGPPSLQGTSVLTLPTP